MKELIKNLSWKNLGWKGKLKFVLVILFLLWLGVPTFNKWKADKLVDELCAKDGGVKVYENDILPKKYFDEKGKIHIPFERDIKLDDQYYLKHTTVNIKGNSASSDISELAVFKQIFRVFRVKDKKIMGEWFIYARTGGDPWGLPIHPSHYSCPSNNILFEEKIFK